MIAKRIKRDPAGRSAATQIRALVTYIFAGDHDDPNDKLIEGGTLNMFSGSPRAAIAEMVALSMACPKSNMPVAHWVLSWKDDETPTVEQVRQAVEMFVEGLGFRGHQVAWGVHGNTTHRHVHIAINRISSETEKVVKPNRGFDKLAAQRALARIENAQGWQPETRAKYVIDDFGRLREKPPLSVDEQPVFRPGYRAGAIEIRQGVKSTQRIAHEELFASIRDAKSWPDLHSRLAYHGAVYELSGGGAVIKIGGGTVKSSDLKASPRTLSKRLGPFQPGDASLTQVVKAAPTPPPQPIDAEAAEYQFERAEHNAAKKAAREAMNIDQRRNDLKEQQRVERASVLAGSWKGRGTEKNALESFLAEKHREERDTLERKIKAGKAALKERFPDFPDFNTWKAKRAANMVINVEPFIDGQAIKDLAVNQAALRDQARERLIEKITSGKATRSSAASVLDSLEKMQVGNVTALGERERERLDAAYKVRRKSVLDTGDWQGRGAERNATAKAFKEAYTKEKDGLETNWRKALRAIQSGVKALRDAVAHAFDPAPTKAAAEQKPRRQSLTPDDVALIYRINPADWLKNARGYSIDKPAANKYSVKSGNDEVYRCVRKPNGDWMTFSKDNSWRGNNIQLLQYEADIYDLLDVGAAFGIYPSGYTPPASVKTAPPRPAPAPVVVERTPFRPPVWATAAEREAGRDYLMKQRAIPVEIIDEAERQGFLAYATHQVVFRGVDDKDALRTAQLRRFDDAKVLEKGMQKGSEPEFPAILVGEDATTVILTESGITALSVAAIERAAGHASPTVISTGGAGMKRWIDQTDSPAALAVKNATTIYIAAENESTEDKQIAKDGDRRAMAERIAAATGRQPLTLYPPTFRSDAADLLKERALVPISEWLSESPVWPTQAGSAPEI